MNEVFKTGERIKVLREELDMTQKQFGEMLSFTSATVSAYENNKKTPVLDFLITVAEKCNVSMDWLCGLSESRGGNFNINKHSDVIECLYQLSNAMNLEIEGIRYSVGKNLDFCDINAITSRNDIFQMFLDEWGEMLSLKNKGTINERLYKLWIEDKKKEYTVIIDPTEEKSFLIGKGYSNGYIHWQNFDVPEGSDLMF